MILPALYIALQVLCHLCTNSKAKPAKLANDETTCGNTGNVSFPINITNVQNGYKYICLTDNNGKRACLEIADMTTFHIEYHQTGEVLQSSQSTYIYIAVQVGTVLITIISVITLFLCCQKCSSKNQVHAYDGQISRPGSTVQSRPPNATFQRPQHATVRSPSNDLQGNRTSPSNDLQGNGTIVKVKMDKKIDSHHGSPNLIQAMSDKMEDFKDQVKAVALCEYKYIMPKGYDFFIIYCGKNSAVVDGIIMPHLNELNITYCEHQEHFIPGRSIFSNIQDCIEQSTKVLAVLSEEFFASGWCCRDLDMAMVQATEKQIEHFIVPIKIDDCVIPDKYGDLKNITYFDLTSSENDSVWEQIRCSLASIRVASMEMEICMCPEHLQIPYNSSSANTWM